MSKIEWTNETWNPVTGCSKISSGCKNCYAERMAHRLFNMGVYNYRNQFQVTLHTHSLEIPYKWKKPRTIFVNSMSDLFHKDVPLEFIQQVFKVIEDTPQHQYQILTKRSERLVELTKSLNWSSNLWMGVSVEDEKVMSRIQDLKKCDANIKFLSVEPLIGPLPNLDISGIDWVIVGGESGPRSRPMKPEWVLDIKNNCQENQIPFFFKQWGGVNKKKTGRVLENRTWDEMPLLTV